MPCPMHTRHLHAHKATSSRFPPPYTLFALLVPQLSTFVPSFFFIKFMLWACGLFSLGFLFKARRCDGLITTNTTPSVCGVWKICSALYSRYSCQFPHFPYTHVELCRWRGAWITANCMVVETAHWPWVLSNLWTNFIGFYLGATQWLNIEHGWKRSFPPTWS